MLSALKIGSLRISLGSPGRNRFSAFCSAAFQIIIEMVFRLFQLYFYLLLPAINNRLSAGSSEQSILRRPFLSSYSTDFKLLLCWIHSVFPFLGFCSITNLNQKTISVYRNTFTIMLCWISWDTGAAQEH